MTWEGGRWSRLHLPVLRIASAIKSGKTRREFAKALDQHLKQIGETEQKAPDWLDESTGWLGGRMVPLVIGQPCMAVAADRNRFAIEGATGDVMQLQRERVIAAADNAARIVASETFKCPLLAALTFQFKIIHGSSSFQTTMR
jgi:hypothetical protein